MLIRLRESIFWSPDRRDYTISSHQHRALFVSLQVDTLTQTQSVMGGELSEELVTQEKRKKGWRLNCDVGEGTEGWRMSCDVGEETESLENEPPGELSEELVTQKKRKKGWRMNCHVGKATEGLENEL